VDGPVARGKLKELEPSEDRRDSTRIASPLTVLETVPLTVPVVVTSGNGRALIVTVPLTAVQSRLTWLVA